MRRALAAAAAALVLWGTAACGAGSAETNSRTVTVFAAASLAPAFTEIARDFEDRHEGVDVRLSFAGSSALAAQILDGAPADVFAPADEPTMARVQQDSVAELSPVVFATNTLVLVVPAGDPARITSVEDLSDEGVRLVLCAEQVPCGAASRRLLEATGTRVDPVSEEQSVSDVLGKVTAGQADAGLVYRTDALAAGERVRSVEVPGAAAVVNRYPVAALGGPDRSALAAKFVDFVSGDEARTVLTTAGFGTP
ncbi:molybdate ABC transporter substrate-binding protein [Aeromicrobium senzhongii]|uniref:Molybdate ABC transporter substrate-binding protein n=1 Tax=Aeromicrobium senzhongii TaxID=2663859 RepID=A0ABX6SQ49_9ACTN|nr:molybdate ABC transporter substrate-binding protein [Aeromicrobium senzhongii]MTB86771.1 molybdate ABC transporter substrate-binding protein [Aeromicrobium senzhongii]QNL93382.1 molybdate ABC transporter substrate-binding protein [Aeromicrobium senzhongii]